MPRQISRNDQNDFSSSASYGVFFQSPTERFERYLNDLEIAKITKAAINILETYQQRMKDRQADRDNYKNLLMKDDLPLFERKEIIEELKCVEAELEEDQAEFQSLVNSDPSLQAHFGFQISLTPTTNTAFS